MATTEEKVLYYKTVIKKLLPKGRLWSFIPDGVLDNLLEGVAVEFARIDDRAGNLIDESDSRTTSEMLADWENDLDIPGVCETLGTTVAQRRQVVTTKETAIGSQNKQSFVDIAASLGYTITVDDVIEYSPFVAGSRCGQPLTNGAWVFTFAIRISGLTTRTFVAGSRAGERLLDYGDDLLECLMTQHKPAHLVILFQAA